MANSPGPDGHTISSPSLSSPGKHAHEPSTPATRADASDTKRFKIEDDGQGNEQLAQSAQTGTVGVGVASERNECVGVNALAHQPPLVSSLNTSTRTPPTPLHRSSLSHSPSPSRDQASHGRNYTPTAHNDESDHSAAVPTPTSARASVSTASSPERKLQKDRAKLPKVAVDRKRKDNRARKRSDKDSKSNKDKKRSKTKTGKEDAHDAEESEDDDAHCICKGANQEDDTFIGCEICDGWFHPGCMGINEESVEMLDIYVCPPCEKTTGRSTVYKRVCTRDGCDKTARATSKYCSSKCAFQQAQSVLATVDKKELSTLETSLAGYPSPTPTVSVETHGDGAAGNGAAEEEGTAALTASLQAQSEQVVRLAELVAQRQALFAQAIARWDALKPVVVAGTAPAPKRKSKTKRRDGDPVVERPCGWDSRLLWSNEELRSWDGKGPEDSEGDVDMDEEERGGMMILSTMCAAGRRCERHQGWQKTLGVALDVEAAQLSRKKDELDAMVERLTRLEEVEAAGAKAQLEVHTRIKQRKE